jgi:hypothetical protein
MEWVQFGISVLAALAALASGIFWVIAASQKIAQPTRGWTLAELQGFARQQLYNSRAAYSAGAAGILQGIYWLMAIPYASH